MSAAIMNNASSVIVPSQNLPAIPSVQATVTNTDMVVTNGTTSGPIQPSGVTLVVTPTAASDPPVVVPTTTAVSVAVSHTSPLTEEAKLLHASYAKTCIPENPNSIQRWYNALTFDSTLIQPALKLQSGTDGYRHLNVFTKHPAVSPKGTTTDGSPIVRIGGKNDAYRVFSIDHGCDIKEDDIYDSMQDYLMAGKQLPRPHRHFQVNVRFASPIHNLTVKLDELCQSMWSNVGGNHYDKPEVVMQSIYEPMVNSYVTKNNATAYGLKLHIYFDAVHQLHDPDVATRIAQSREAEVKNRRRKMTAAKLRASEEAEARAKTSRGLYVYRVKDWNGNIPVLEEVFDMRPYISDLVGPKARSHNEKDSFDAFFDCDFFVATTKAPKYTTKFRVRRMYIVPKQSDVVMMNPEAMPFTAVEDDVAELAAIAATRAIKRGFDLTKASAIADAMEGLTSADIGSDAGGGGGGVVSDANKLACPSGVVHSSDKHAVDEASAAADKAAEASIAASREATSQAEASFADEFAS